MWGAPLGEVLHLTLSGPCETVQTTEGDAQLYTHNFMITELLFLIQKSIAKALNFPEFNITLSFT